MKKSTGHNGSHYLFLRQWGFLSFLLFMKFFTAPVKQPATGPHVTLRGDYIFLLFEIILGIFYFVAPFDYCTTLQI